MGAGRWLSTHGTQVLVSTQLLGSKRGTTLFNSSSPGLLLTLLRVALGGGESMPYSALLISSHLTNPHQTLVNLLQSRSSIDDFELISLHGC